MDWEYFEYEIVRKRVDLDTKISTSVSKDYREDIRCIRENYIGEASCFGKRKGKDELSKDIIQWNKTSIEVPKTLEKINFNVCDERIVHMDLDDLKDYTELYLKHRMKVQFAKDTKVMLITDIIKKKYENSNGVNYSYKKTLVHYVCNSTFENSLGENHISLKDVSTSLRHSFDDPININGFIAGNSRPNELMNKNITCIITGQALKGIYFPLRNLIKKSPDVIFNSNFNVLDNPLAVSYENSYPYDDEGILGKEKKLIENGRIVGHINSLATACKNDETPTGNGVRSIDKRSIAARYSNMIIKAGSINLTDAIKNIENGYLIYNIEGNGINNLGSGKLVLIIDEAYVIKNGSITGLAKNITCIGNVLEIFSDENLRFGDEAHYVNNGIYSPFLVTDKIKVN